MKPKVAIVRGKFLNRYEMQFYEPLVTQFDVTAFGSGKPYHDKFNFPVVKLSSPMDLPDFPFKMPILNRLFIDAHYLWGLENNLKGFELVHTAETYYHYTQQCINAKRKGYVKKVIATVLENIPFNNEKIWGRKAFKKRARTDLDQIIALTQKTKSGLVAEGADPEKISVIGHFVDSRRFRPIKKDPSNNRITILFVGRLEIYKGVFDILYAADKLLHDPEISEYQLTFMFTGMGSEYSRMKDLEKQLGIENYIIHANALYDAMPEVYQTADIFVAPSKTTKTWEEQYNTSLLEAQASGLAIVTTNTGGIPENVGNAALIVNPGDIDKLTDAIKKFIKDKYLRIKYASIARQRAEKIHDIGIGAQKLEELYHRLLA
jgi:glycosyltransferase involved in cell wall biosynthesis